MNIENIRNKNIIVVGDYMLDGYIAGKAIKISPEAPVPVVLKESEKFVLGGAGNVVNNLFNLGINVFSVGITGSDHPGTRIQEDLKKISNTEGFYKENISSTVKTRIIADNQQVVRLDQERVNEITDEMRKKVYDFILNTVSMNKIDAIIFEDYGKGLFTGEFINAVNDIAIKSGIFTALDPCLNTSYTVKKLSLFKPNLYEALRISDTAIRSSVETICRKLMNKWETEYITVTCGSEGMSLLDSNGKYTNINTEAKEVFDVSGAGDTVISVLTACMVSGFSFGDSAKIANMAAGIVVGKAGTAPITFKELSEAVKNI